jgi:hypothetical protein
LLPGVRPGGTLDKAFPAIKVVPGGWVSRIPVIILPFPAAGFAYALDVPAAPD